VAERSWVVVERARTETALRDSERRFHELADNISQFAWTADATGSVNWYNKRWHDYTGLTLQEMQDWGRSKVHHPDHVDRIVAAFSEALRTGDPFEETFPLRSKDGEYRWFLTRVLPIRDDEGDIVRWFGTNTDVTALHETKDALRGLNTALEGRIEEARASEQRFHELADNISQFAWTADASGRINWYNQRWYDYTGTSLAEMEGWGWTKVHHPDHVDRIVQSFSEALRNGQSWEGTVLLRSKSGEYRWFLSRVLPIRNDEGDVVRWFGTNTDVTALREAKDALRDLNETLESRVVEEVAAHLKTEETLRQSQKMEAVGQLTGGIAHDFNNLLQSISGNLEMLQARVAQGRAAEAVRYVSAAMGSVERASALTQRLLAFSRKKALDPEPVNANPLVAGMEDMIRRAVGPAIEVEVMLAGGLWTTVCDAHQLENAVLNLAINARDALPVGGRLTIETANAYLDDAYAQQQGDGVVPGQYVSISVTDTGTGMPADVAKRAFEPFFTTKPVGQGTGLGLSMLYGFTKQNNGHARIHSEQGRGTTVLLYLPRELGSGTERDDGADADGTERAGARRTVLVVEDDPAVRMLAVEAMRD
jgi:PAS domain S-box-containing protein